MRRAWTASFLPFTALALTGCVPAPAEGQPRTGSATTPMPRPIPTLAPAATPAPTPAPQGPASFVVSGKQTQGGWIRGQAPTGAVRVTLDGAELPLDGQGWFFAAFDRDAGPQARLVAMLGAGREIATVLTIAPRAWNIEHINAARLPGGPTEAFMQRRRPELDRIAAARKVDSDSDGWRQSFVWPVKGRISGRFGSQRVYRGEPGAYHSGLDLATGTSGTPYVAPADGVVVLAAQSDFSLEGKLLIIDHGNGLNSAFLHSSRLYVKEGDRVRQGQHIGDIGMSGRATGPHLHWGITWRGSRLDPLLFLGPMN